jgi:hypothetical protein
MLLLHRMLVYGSSPQSRKMFVPLWLTTNVFANEADDHFAESVKRMDLPQFERGEVSFQLHDKCE